MSRRIAFVLAASDQGSLIVNRLDWCADAAGQGYGVGFQILDSGGYDQPEVAQIVQLLAARRACFGDGVVAMDCGANIGVQTTAWARAMSGWGSVLSIEPQERLFYALAGNIALNNCFNARAFHMAVGADVGTIRVPRLDYLSPGSFGSLELRGSVTAEFIGQKVDYSAEGTEEVRCMNIDSMGLTRLDLLKVDVEGMENEVLDGAAATLRTQRPIVVVEHIKVGCDSLFSRLSPLGYTIFQTPINLIAIHESDPTLGAVSGLR